MRSFCPVCERAISVLKDGTLRAHGYVLTDPYNDRYCLGAGRPPAGESRLPMIPEPQRCDRHWIEAILDMFGRLHPGQNGTHEPLPDIPGRVPVEARCEACRIANLDERSSGGRMRVDSHAEPAEFRTADQPTAPSENPSQVTWARQGAADDDGRFVVRAPSARGDYSLTGDHAYSDGTTAAFESGLEVTRAKKKWDH